MDTKKALHFIDARNALDSKVIESDGNKIPYELWYAKKCSEWLYKMDANPSVELQIAVRGAHIARFEKPRDSYPAGKDGYYNWKKDLQVFHGTEVSKILKSLNFPETTIARVYDIITKKNLAKDSEVKILEDILSLLFIEFQLADLMEKLPQEKVIKAIKMTWSKMSEKGKSYALKLTLTDKELEVIKLSIEE